MDFRDSDGDVTMPKVITMTAVVTYFLDDFLTGFAHFRMDKKLFREAKNDRKHFLDDFSTGITSTYGKAENNDGKHFLDDF
mmetsp:Transcript_21175/g.42425  ORF Transcript_21175/g.42425 Transcript_21175/m.42425 type:complete len:81 (+) Transcript_21175:689-931(+)